MAGPNSTDRRASVIKQQGRRKERGGSKLVTTGQQREVWAEFYMQWETTGEFEAGGLSDLFRVFLFFVFF